MRRARRRASDFEVWALRELLLSWDPLGIGPEGPRDEYDDLAIRLLSTSVGPQLQDAVAEHWLGRPMSGFVREGWNALAESWRNRPAP